MKLEERSYSGKTFRPRPLLVADEAGSTLFVVTPWGHHDDAERVVQIFNDQLQIRDAEDFTSPFGYVESLGPIANRLRTAAHLANDYLFRDVNQMEYRSGLEVLALVYREGVLSWVQVGGPHLLLVDSGGVQPLASQLDWSWQFNQTAPLPSSCLGVQKSMHIQCGSVVIDSGASLFLLARGAVPSTVFQTPTTDLSAMARTLVADNSETPFWLGHIVT